MANSGVIKGAAPLNIIRELNSFAESGPKVSKHNPLDLARTALTSMQSFPSVRDAVLDHLSSLFDSAASQYFTPKDEISANPLDISNNDDIITAISEIHNVLCNFVNTSPGAWAPIISTWSMKLLGNLSSQYAKRADITVNTGLNETLNLWMSCRATRTLIDVTTQCLSCLMNSDAEACVNSLLEISVTHSPHFDWVVAHVGSCFPHFVITRVLSCGLKDFCLIGSAEQGAKSAKLGSVVGILDHLTASHFTDIRRALLELFKASLNPAKNEELQFQATVPFLLQLASLSPQLRKALTTDVLHTLTPDMLPQLAVLAPEWCHYFGCSEALEDLLVHLALGCEQGGTQILKLLLEAASPLDWDESQASEIKKKVRAASRDILELLLQEIDLQLRSTSQGNGTIPLLCSLKQELALIQPLLLSEDNLRMLTAVRLLCMLGYHSQGVVIASASYLLQNATTNNHLAALVRLCTGVISALPTSSVLVDQEGNESIRRNYLSQAIEQAIQNCLATFDESLDRNVQPEQLWLNLAKLLRWESNSHFISSRDLFISYAVKANLKEIADILHFPPNLIVAHSVASTLDLLDVPLRNQLSGLNVELILKLTKAAVCYFFLCARDRDKLARLKGSQVCCRLLSRLCVCSAAARSFALREILEGSIYQSPSYMFGAKINTKLVEFEDVLLLNENHKQGTSSMLAQRHSSVFHAGIIGHGPRRSVPHNTLPPEILAENVNMLIEAVKACCSLIPAPSVKIQVNFSSPIVHPISLDAVTTVSLLLVELISPDVMYNGLPWPEEDFCKVTVERDLHIWRVFDEIPVVWQLMRFVASHRPALCYCSVLLRALTATLIAQWGSSSQRCSPKLMDVTVNVLELMSLGQLLPPPIASLRDVIPHVRAIEVVQLLRDCVWNYLRDHVPSPALFTQDSSGLMWRDSAVALPSFQYTETLRFILQSNIHKFGTLYSELFLTSNKEE